MDRFPKVPWKRGWPEAYEKDHVKGMEALGQATISRPLGRPLLY
jgi:hypothetical protein